MHNNCKLQVCQQKRNSILSSVIICFILTRFYITLQPQMCVCVCRFGISFTYIIKIIDSKLISVCLINDYLSTYIYLFMDAQNAIHFTQMYKGETSYIK